jgi:hypothetical protein
MSCCILLNGTRASHGYSANNSLFGQSHFGHLSTPSLMSDQYHLSFRKFRYSHNDGHFHQHCEGPAIHDYVRVLHPLPPPGRRTERSLPTQSHNAVVHEGEALTPDGSAVFLCRRSQHQQSDVWQAGSAHNTCSSFSWCFSVND